MFARTNGHQADESQTLNQIHEPMNGSPRAHQYRKKFEWQLVKTEELLLRTLHVLDKDGYLRGQSGTVGGANGQRKSGKRNEPKGRTRDKSLRKTESGYSGLLSKCLHTLYGIRTMLQ